MRRRGHAAHPHTADVILEAWGPDLPTCCEEAVAALVGTYVDAVDGAPTERCPVHLGPAADGELVLALVDEVIFTLDTADGVPVAAEVRPAADGGLDVTLLLAGRHQVRGTGAVPKAVSRSDLHVSRGPDGVRCRFLVDV